MVKNYAKMCSQQAFCVNPGDAILAIRQLTRLKYAYNLFAEHFMTNQAYKDAGVDIDAGNLLVEKIKPLAKNTNRSEVLGNLGGFGGCFQLDWQRYQQPVLVSGTDGVGTKLKLACDWQQHDTIGIDLVAMCANDILTCGAEPLFFLDYYATSALDVTVATNVVAGISNGCQQAGMALLGGETAEMPGLYQPGDYDLAGFCVGIVEKTAMIDGSQIQVGDALIGLASSGIHSNGYSLVRKILDDNTIDLNQTIDGVALKSLLLAPTQIYVKTIQRLLTKFDIRGMAHITGGGLLENIPRILPTQTNAEIDPNSWPTSPLYQWLFQQADLSENERFTTFNCGIGYVLCLPQAEATACLAALQELQQPAWVIGQVIAGNADTTPKVTFK